MSAAEGRSPIGRILLDIVSLRHRVWLARGAALSRESADVVKSFRTLLPFVSVSMLTLLILQDGPTGPRYFMIVLCVGSVLGWLHLATMARGYDMRDSVEAAAEGDRFSLAAIQMLESKLYALAFLIKFVVWLFAFTCAAFLFSLARELLATWWNG